MHVPYCSHSLFSFLPTKNITIDLTASDDETDKSSRSSSVDNRSRKCYRFSFLSESSLVEPPVLRICWLNF